MRFTSTLVMFMAPFLWSWMSFTDAENTVLINNAAPASNVKTIVNKIRRLRGVQKLQDEERMEATDVGMANLLDPVHSSQTVGNHKPLLRFGSVLQILLVYWMLVGGLVAVSKMVHKSFGDSTVST
ncbi:hypothetical protein PC129_g20736 [Phytophthora cactorum]|uniref:RxLR effector protein n=1 Tax=Phytophthora cactorum TaxID=29920 RepID=A0A329RFR4_9STRA|nr:hypothetical protein GQ600_24526 [Phytophthora cactorum]KAG2784864.1 hypothetical protein Pcac1_g5547 [Phytophthora cactorum]KAG2798049.1 hypothetical protein PC111_g21019 [Phytophthora cactorum]KAG2798122.1 hypothetical protein PC112_g21494 [Phytophthora cactorum]KAG2828519.1 hypothetical protein PC113_g21453 [Phytophthora cactorum]